MSAAINISNYEAFLLRYIDGDLSAAELAGLQDFLEQHPHVQQELQVWESTVLTPDLQVTFDHKEMLYRGTPAIHADNQTGFLLSYIDQELSGEEKAAVDQYLAITPAAQAELALLQMTRLQPDMGQVFEPKAILYRHRRRVTPLYWWAASAAAVVAGLLVWVLPLQHTQTGTSSALVAAVQTPAATPVPQATINTPVTNAPTTVNTNTPQTATLASAQQTGNNTVATNNAANTTAANTARVNTTSQSINNTPATTVAVNTPATVPATDAASNSNNNLIAANTTGNTNNTTLSRTTNATNASSGTEPSTTATSAVVAVSIPDVPADKPPVMLAAATPKEMAAAPSVIHGELIASVVGTGDSKLLDKVTNVARFFAKKKANNK